MNIDLEKLLFWDLETAPREDFNENHPLFETWKNKNRKEKLTTEELIEKFNLEGGLYGEYLRIVCLSCAFIHSGEIRLNSYVGDEKYIIDEFLKVAQFVYSTKNNIKSTGLISVGHNVCNYDIPVFRKVFSRYYPMFTLPDYLSDLNTKGLLPIAEKPWVMNERVLDTLQLQKGANFNFSSMAETAINLGIPSPKLDTDGSKVGQLFKAGEIDKIKKYCEGDVLTSVKILFNWMGQDMLPIAEKKVEQKEIVDLTLLEKLNLQKSIYTSELKELKTILNKPKLTKKDKDICFELIKASLSEIDSNFGKVVNQKEIEQIINQLKQELENNHTT